MPSPGLKNNTLLIFFLGEKLYTVKPATKPSLLLLHAQYTDPVGSAHDAHVSKNTNEEHVGLSNAFLHNSAARAKICARMSDLRCFVTGHWQWGGA